MTLLPDVLAGLPRTADQVVRADEVEVYRRLVLSALVPPIDGGRGPLTASPLQPFVVAWSSFDRAVSILTGQDEPRVVHLSQQIEQRRPLEAGDVIRSELSVLGVRHERKGVRITFRSDLLDGGGTDLASLITTLAVLGASSPEPFGQTAHHRADPMTHHLADVSARIPVDLPPRYAAVTNDHNPIHLDHDAAVAAGMDGVVAHGMSLVAVVVEEAVRRFLDGDAGRVKGVGVRFSQPVHPGEDLTITFGRHECRPTRLLFTVRSARGLAQKWGWIDDVG